MSELESELHSDIVVKKQKLFLFDYLFNVFRCTETQINRCREEGNKSTQKPHIMSIGDLDESI